MRVLLLVSFVVLAFGVAAQENTLQLGNEPWPPFVLEGEDQGTAEQIVCEALMQAGFGCALNYGAWEDMLSAAETGELDGIAAVWFTPERGKSLVFSSPYLTNRLVPVTAVGGPAIRQVSDLAERRVALEVDVAYGDTLLAAKESFTVVPVRGAENALEALRQQEAEVAIVDELFARELLDSPDHRDLVIGDVALAYRELHFAVSRTNPQAEKIVAGFNQAYRVMLRDGTVNQILDMDWVATDLGADGVMDFIHRGGGLDPQAGDAAGGGSVYALGQDEYAQIRDPEFSGSNVRYLADDQAYETPEAAMNALDTGRRCRFDRFTAHMICERRR